MHYYKFNIKDWSRDTAHLSVEEEGVYRRLLDQYYESEMPIPEQTQQVIRRLRLSGHEESVALILGEFFTLEADGYRHARCDLEIEKYHSKAQANRVNGKSGGRPKKPKENPDGYDEEPNRNLNQEPQTNNQEPQEIKSSCDQQAESPERERIPFEKIRAIYNEICVPTLSEALKLSEDRKRNIRKCWSMEISGDKPFKSGDFWRQYFTDCLLDQHWIGNNDRGWKADIEFLTRETSVLKVLERA